MECAYFCPKEGGKWIYTSVYRHITWRHHRFGFSLTIKWIFTKTCHTNLLVSPCMWKLCLHSSIEYVLALYTYFIAKKSCSLTVQGWHRFLVCKKKKKSVLEKHNKAKHKHKRKHNPKPKLLPVGGGNRIEQLKISGCTCF